MRVIQSTLSVVAVVLATGCSQSLDRQTAERLIREAGEIPGRLVEFGLRSPAFLDSTPGSFGSLVRATEATRWNAAFVDKLVNAGVLAWHEERTYRVGNGGIYGFQTDRPFSALSQPFVSMSNDYVTLVLATPELRRVTGIIQEEEESAAVVEAEIGLKPTPLYERLVPFVAEMLVECHRIEQKPYACDHWPTQEAFDTIQTRAFAFRRYDDGWRLQPQ